MATTTQNYGTSTAATITIASLANGSGRASTAIDNTTAKCTSADIFVKIKTNAAGTSATGYIDVYLVRSEDGSTWDDQYVGTTQQYSGTDAAFAPTNSTKIGIISAVANSSIYQGIFNTSIFGELPRKFAICLVNNSGAALDSTAGNHAVTVTLKKYDIA